MLKTNSNSTGASFVIYTAEGVGEPLSGKILLRGDNRYTPHMEPLSRHIQAELDGLGEKSSRLAILGAYMENGERVFFCDDLRTKRHEEAHSIRDRMGISNEQVAALGLQPLDEGFARAMEDVDDPPMESQPRYRASGFIQLCYVFGFQKMPWEGEISLPPLLDDLYAHPRGFHSHFRWTDIALAAESFGLYPLLIDLLRSVPRDEAFHHLKVAFQKVDEPQNLRAALAYLGGVVFEATGAEHFPPIAPTRMPGLGTRKTLALRAKDGDEFELCVYTTFPKHGDAVINAVRKYALLPPQEDNPLSSLEETLK